MREGTKHRKAFDYYYGLGDDRTSQMVANRFSVSRRSVEVWKKEFNWQERIQQRDIENAKRIEKKTDNTIVNAKADYRFWIKKRLKEIETEYNYLSRVYGTAKEKIEKGEIEVGSIKDLTDLSRVMQGVDKERREFVKLDMLLIGEATDRHEHEGELSGTLAFVIDYGDSEEES